MAEPQELEPAPEPVTGNAASEEVKVEVTEPAAEPAPDLASVLKELADTQSRLTEAVASKEWAQEQLRLHLAAKDPVAEFVAWLKEQVKSA